MPVTNAQSSKKKRFCFKKLFFFFLLISFSFCSENCFGILPGNDSSIFKYQESETILRDFSAHPHKLSKPDRKILRKEFKFQRKKADDKGNGNIGLQIFLLILLSLAILWGTFLVVLVLGAYEVLPIFLIILIGAIGIASIVFLLIGGSKRIKRRRQLNAERNKNESNPAPVQ